MPAEFTSVSLCGTTPDVYMKRVVEENGMKKIPADDLLCRLNVGTLLSSCRYNVHIAFLLNAAAVLNTFNYR